jgi:hypothetical protein
LLATIVQIGLLVLAVLAFLGAGFLLVRSVVMRAGLKKYTYGVERQTARQNMLAYAFSSAFLLLVSLLLCGLGGVVWFVWSGEDEAVVAVTTTTTAVPEFLPTAVGTPVLELPLEGVLTPIVSPTPQLTNTPELTATLAPPVEPITPTLTVTPTVAVTPTPEFPTAVVNSPFVGLYLRTAPAGDIIERLEDRAEVLLLGPEQVVGELRWVEVRAVLTGNSGWVAADFLAEPGSLPPLEN